MSATINTNYPTTTYSVSEQARERVISESKAEAPTGEQTPESATMRISPEGMKSYRESLVKAATEGLENSENGKGVVISDYDYMLSSRLPSIYGEKDENGEYERHYYTVSEKADNLVKAYEEAYDEIVKGHEAGTRETFTEDESAENGYRRLTMEEEIEELDKAFGKMAEKFEARENTNLRVLEILNANREKIAKISNGTSKLGRETGAVMEKNKNDVVPKKLAESVIKAAKATRSGRGSRRG